MPTFEIMKKMAHKQKGSYECKGILQPYVHPIEHAKATFHCSPHVSATTLSWENIWFFTSIKIMAAGGP